MSGNKFIQKRSKNHLKVIDTIALTTFYNDFIHPIGDKYAKVSESAKTGLCPFHDDHRPSMNFWRDAKKLHCFACGHSMDIVYSYTRLMYEVHNRVVTAEEAIRELAKLYNIDLDKDEFYVESPLEEARRKLNELANVNIVKPNSAMTITRFKSLNRHIKGLKLPTKTKVKSFADLDLNITLEVLKDKERKLQA